MNLSTEAEFDAVYSAIDPSTEGEDIATSLTILGERLLSVLYSRSALELIAEKGFPAAPMAMIADHANVASGTIYHFFKTRTN